MTDVYGEGFAAVYASPRYGVFSRRLVKLALTLIERNRPPGHELLDLACGAGNGTLALAAAGYDVSGIDASATMTALAEESARVADRPLRLYTMDMRTFSLPYQVDIVACLFDSLNYLTQEDELSRTFEQVAAVLREQGLFIFDMNTEHALANRWGTKEVVSTTRDNLMEVNRYRYDSNQCTNTITTTVFVRQPDTDSFRRYTETHRQRAYSAERITELLNCAGFEVLSLEGLAEQFHGLAEGLAPLTPDMGRMMIVALRSGVAQGTMPTSGSRRD